MTRFCLLLLVLLPAFARANEPTWSAEKRNHWAWRGPVRPAPPPVKNGAWVRNPIDAFILARLEAASLMPAAPASRIQLIRRVTFDLIGLPPTPAEIDAFGADRSPDAWEKVVDRLLASPHYGERWGRHWLDLARFAESNGYEYDEPRPNAWRYRDYVIGAFNADKPYDRFIKEQLAGDELYPDDPQALIATGFHLLGPDMTDAASQAQRRQNTLDDMTDTVGLAFLGLTVGCARCHNHKFEPMSQRDYYRLQAFFTPAEYRRDLPIIEPAERPAFAKKFKQYQEAAAPVQANLEALESPYRAKLLKVRLAKVSEAIRIAYLTPPPQRTPAQKEAAVTAARLLNIPPKELVSAMTPEHRAEHDVLLGKLKKLDALKPIVSTAMALQETGKTPRTFILRRGELRNPGAEVSPGWLTILSPGYREAPAEVKAPLVAKSSGRRTALAEWITRPDHPLTARVIVNRLWQHHFGRGLVATASDFGLRGAAPTHPELLDWLACELVNPGQRRNARAWSLKHLHRLMLTSATYQQSTTGTSQAAKADPANTLLGRMNRLRLEGEIIRDSLLALGGRLNPKMGGPGVFPPLPAGTNVGTPWKTGADPADHVRRSVYIFAKRNLRFPFLEPFDVPDSNQSCPQRERSTTAPQALTLLNAPDVLAAAQALAARLEKEAPDAGSRITLAYRLTLGRVPSAVELRLSREFLNEASLRELCRALFNVNEFVYLD